jgi:hypothetical protein
MKDIQGIMEKVGQCKVCGKDVHWIVLKEGQEPPKDFRLDKNTGAYYDYEILDKGWNMKHFACEELKPYSPEWLEKHYGIPKDKVKIENGNIYVERCCLKPVIQDA